MTVLLHVQLKFQIRAEPDAAWAALHSPAVLAALYGPIIALEPLDSHETGLNAAVRLRLFGRITLGTQLIGAYDEVREHDGRPVRILRDSGIPLTGPMSVLDVWDHRMAVSALPGGGTLWRDRLVFGGPITTLPSLLALWPALWATWQWRGWRIRRLARRWS
ncbi:hypothetical protein [Microbacterium capsulatum]|uniref:SRPBCC family protein n=1 Tax=Microbacterium capsulatum TaxID=3041921 RepID=A0ABU0XKP1_9MICO|nr:hypothetical protein [Microbacterium sp. ASV81]MDQ4215701.1 hypothetical protein [Microbacterium sp. ASV81]